MLCNGTLQLSVKDVLDDGPKQIVSEARPQQLMLAETVERALLAGKHVIAEAGTGVGKSFSLILPPILQGLKTVVSTATLALQDQYYDKDLPFLAEELGKLGVHFRYALAKGKSNYVCKQKIATLKINIDAQFKKWLKKTEFGDKRELKRDVPKYWFKITAEDCPGEKYCPKAPECGYIGAKALLAQADVIVANHAIVGFSILLGPGKILPIHSVYVIDEAHQAVNYFRNALAARLNETSLPNIVGYLLESGAAEMVRIDEHNFDNIERLNTELFNKFTVNFDGAQERFELSKLEDTVDDLETSLDLINVRLGVAIKAEMQENQPDKNRLSILTVSARKVDRAQRTLSKLGTADPAEDVLYIKYPMTKKQHRELICAPIFIGDILKERLHCHVVTTAASATLAMGTDFAYRKKELGLNLDKDSIVEFITDSPFDFGKQTLLYCSKTVPIHPSRRGLRGKEYEEGLLQYFNGMATEISDLIKYSNGGAFVLFTAFTEMSEIFKRVKKIIALPMQMQEKGIPASSLEEWFRATKDAVLFGVRSFWQGIDIQGDQLRLVIVTKTPFPQQGDLVYSAKKERLVKVYGGNTRRAFKELDIPEMIGDMKQGLGRLIRTSMDYGVAAILDRKVTDQGNRPGTYANQLIQALPFTKITMSQRDVIHFYRRHRGK